MVCRTGLHTAMGQTIRELLEPTKAFNRKDPLVVVCPLLVLCCMIDQENMIPLSSGMH